MADFEMEYPRKYVETTRKLITSDKVHASVFNQIISLLLNNDAFLNEYMKNIETALTEHTIDSIHVTQEEKKDWTNKAENAVATELSNGLMEKEDKKKINTVEENAEENQNAFSDVKIGKITISANGKTAQIELVSGDNISIIGDNATKKIKIEVKNLGDVSTLQTSSKNNLVAAVNEIFKKSNATEDNIGSLETLSTATKNNLVAAVNECFINANNGKKSIATAIGGLATANDTFSMLAQKIDTQREEYRATITSITNEKNQWYQNYIEMMNQKNTWYQNYLNMETDRNNWMNLANSKKSYSTGTIPNTYGSTTIKVQTGFRPRIVHLGCTKSGGTPCNIAYVADYNIQYKAGYGDDGASGGDGTIVAENDGFTFRIPISSSIQLYSIYYIAWS